jgi:hypothetical protein
MAERITRSMSGTPRIEISGLLPPLRRSLLPLPAAIIKHVIRLLSSDSVDKCLGHPIGFIIAVLPGRVFHEIG